MLPGLLDRVWRVKRLIAWPVGNMYPQGCELAWNCGISETELTRCLTPCLTRVGLGLMCEKGQQHHFRLGWAPQRVFPIECAPLVVHALRCVVPRLTPMRGVVSQHARLRD